MSDVKYNLVSNFLLMSDATMLISIRFHNGTYSQSITVLSEFFSFSDAGCIIRVYESEIKD